MREVRNPSPRINRFDLVPVGEVQAGLHASSQEVVLRSIAGTTRVCADRPEPMCLPSAEPETGLERHCAGAQRTAGMREGPPSRLGDQLGQRAARSAGRNADVAP